ncbi:hypothetical protein GCM10009836_05480 [Pseudonocardia ailaonensis]|uniref:Uncharacterized protein n=1 Tax=Pseudonocardia ailaonensis TaxID=367279 RepID=A0ABN2MKP6_9PSEU
MSGTETTRVTPSGQRLHLTVPTAFGPYRWYGSTRFTGPRMARQFFLAPAGEHRVIPTKILPGARTSVRSLRGFDAIVVEAADRSDSALVLAGPHHEATTWFGGPAPEAGALAKLVDTFRFVDSADGASLTPASDLLVQQPDVTVAGRNADSVLMVRRAAEALPTLPDWAGLTLAGGLELWKADRNLESGQAAAVAGTVHQWRYLIAGPQAVMDLVLLGPESGRPQTGLDGDSLVDALGSLTAVWN